MNRGNIRITYELLEHALRLPNGVRIEYVEADPNSRTVNIYVVGEDGISGLYKIAEGQVAPAVSYEDIVDGRPSALYGQIID